MKYVACYGDSLVQGFPFGPRYSWTAQVEKLTQIKMLNYGVCGDCCDDIIYRMRQYALPEYVQHVLFLAVPTIFCRGAVLRISAAITSVCLSGARRSSTACA